MGAGARCVSFLGEALEEGSCMSKMWQCAKKSQATHCRVISGKADRNHLASYNVGVDIPRWKVFAFSPSHPLMV